MNAKSIPLVQQRQNPLRRRYRTAPTDAWFDDHAHSVDSCGGDCFHGQVVPANSTGEPIRFGIHRAVGGYHDLPSPGDLLSAALAACLDSSVRMLAGHLGVALRSLDVTVHADCDARGCLLVERAVPVGFQRMRCRVRLRPAREVDGAKLRTLLAAAEASCVVLQTLRNGVPVETEIVPAMSGEDDVRRHDDAARAQVGAHGFGQGPL